MRGSLGPGLVSPTGRVEVSAGAVGVPVAYGRCVTLPPLIPRSVLFGNPDHASPSVSPDGRLLGYVAPLNGVLNVWVQPLDGWVPARAVTHDDDRGVRSYAFCHDDRHLLYVQDKDGDESWRLYLLDLFPDGESPDEPAVLVTPGTGVQARIVAHNRWHRDEVLVALNDRDPQLHDLHRLDLRTGELVLVAENPGFADWLVDSDLRIRGGASMTPDGGVTVLLGSDGQYETYLEIPPDDAASTDVLGFTRDGSALLVLSSMDANATRLERHDLATGDRTVLAADDAYDVGGVWLDPATLEPQAVEFERDRQKIVLLDESLRADLDRLHALGDGDLGVGRRERGDRLWMVSLSPSDGPVRWFVYDRSTGHARYLFAHRAELEGQPLAPMEPFSFTARDGLT